MNSKKNIYFDNAATTRVDPRVVEAMLPYFSEHYGNPSSGHSLGQGALDAVEEARKIIADAMGADPKEIIFTGSGTEANNTALWGVGRACFDRGNHIITTSIEHHAVGHAADFMKEWGFDVTVVPVGEHGVVDPQDIERAINPKTTIITVMHANNEIGTIQPIKEIGEIAQKNQLYLHTDAVQTFGHLPMNVTDLGVSLLSISGHKLYASKGVGVLYLKQGTPFVPFIHGGGHERGRRAATHNVPGIVGLGKAAQIALAEMESETKLIRKMRKDLWEKIQDGIDGVHLNGDFDQRLPNNLNISIDHVESEALLMNLDLEGIAASGGSACSTGSQEPSHVLQALNLPKERLNSSLRMSLGRFNVPEEVDIVVDALGVVVKRLRELSSF